MLRAASVRTPLSPRGLPRLPPLRPALTREPRQPRQIQQIHQIPQTGQIHQIQQVQQTGRICQIHQIQQVRKIHQIHQIQQARQIHQPHQARQPRQPRQIHRIQQARHHSGNGAASSSSSNPAMAFPCLDALEQRTQQLQTRLASEDGPEPSYTTGAHATFASPEPLLLDHGGVLRGFDVAYETWGSLDAARSNAVLLHTGLSASSHAHSSPANPRPGWWEAFIGPGRPLDTDRLFVVCANVLGGCYGSTGPSSADPADGLPYATRFPIVSIGDMVRAQFRLLDALGIDRLYASVGASMGGMQSLAAAALFPTRVGRIVSISGCASSHPYSIAIRHTQRQVLMADPKWNRGHYYGSVPPHAGMKLARQIATVNYRSGPEWEARFGRERADPSQPPALCPDFLVETYLDHAGEKFCLQFDANSLLYVSKAMDLFDLGAAAQQRTAQDRTANAFKLASAATAPSAESAGSGASDASASSDASGGGNLDDSSRADVVCSLALPSKPYKEQPRLRPPPPAAAAAAQSAARTGRPPEDLVKGLVPLRDHKALVVGVASDILFPAWQQREIADALRAGGNTHVTHVEFDEDQCQFGHDSFLLDLENIGGCVGRFLAD